MGQTHFTLLELYKNQLVQTKDKFNTKHFIYVQTIQQVLIIIFNKNKQKLILMNQPTTFYFPFNIDLREYQTLQTVQQIEQFYQMLIHTDQYRRKKIKAAISTQKYKYRSKHNNLKKVRIFFTCCKLNKKHPFLLFIKSQLTGTYQLDQLLTIHDHKHLLIYQKNTQKQDSEVKLPSVDISNNPDQFQTLRKNFLQGNPLQIQKFKQWKLNPNPAFKDLVQMSKSRGKKRLKQNQKSKFEKDKKQLESQGYVEYHFPLQKQLNQINSFDTVCKMVETLQRLLGLSHHKEKKIQYKITQFNLTVNPYQKVEVSFPCCDKLIPPFISYKNTKRSHYQLDSCNLIHYHKLNGIGEEKVQTLELEKKQRYLMKKLEKPVEQSQKAQKS